MGPEHKYNLVLLGAVGVGKSALTVKYITKRFIMDYDPFIEGTYTKTDIVDNHEVLVKIRDTYLENLSDIGKYLKWADGYLVVYSIASRDSFEHARRLLELLRRHVKSRPVNCPIVLLGNKSDLEGCRQVSTLAGRTLAAQLGCSAFCEASASEEYATVETAVHSLVREVQRERDGDDGDAVSVGCIAGIADAASNLELPALFAGGDEFKSMSLPAGGAVLRSGSGGSAGQVRRSKTAKIGGGGSGATMVAAAGAASPEEHRRRRANGGSAGEGKRSPGGSAGGSGSGGFRLFNKSFKIFS